MDKMILDRLQPTLFTSVPYDETQKDLTVNNKYNIIISGKGAKYT